MDVLAPKRAVVKNFNFVNKWIIFKTKMKITCKILYMLGCLRVTMTTVWASSLFAVSEHVHFFLNWKKRHQGTRKNNYTLVNLQVRIEICHSRYITILKKQVLVILSFSHQCQICFLLMVLYLTDELQNVCFPDNIR